MHKKGHRHLRLSLFCLQNRTKDVINTQNGLLDGANLMHPNLARPVSAHVGVRSCLLPSMRVSTAVHKHPGGTPELNHSNVDLLVTGLVNVFSTWVHVWGVVLTDSNRKNRFCCWITEESKLIAYIVPPPPSIKNQKVYQNLNVAETCKMPFSL